MKTAFPNTTTNTEFMVDDFKPMKIQGVPVVYSDKPGRNKNMYPKDVLLDAIKYYKQVVELDPTYKYSFAKHPKDENEEWIGLIAAAVDDIYFDENENVIRADFTLLPTIWGKFISWLIENGYNVGVSLRGKADKQSIMMDVAGKTMAINKRSNLRLEGIDFVIYPSYIVTNANNDHIVKEQSDGTELCSILPHLCSDCDAQHTSIFESFVSSVSEENGLSIDKIKNMFNQYNNNRRTEDMLPDDIKVQEAELRIERLTIDKDKLEQQIEKMQETISSYETQSKTQQKEVESLNEQIEEKRQIVAGLNTLEDRLLAKKEELTQVNEELTKTQEELKKLTAEIAQLNDKAGTQLAVRIAGQTFSSDNPPRVRVVPVSERVTEADWGSVRKDSLKQLLWLSKNEEAVKESVSYVSENPSSWEAYSHPTHQAFKSNMEGYDIDLVLNVNALDDAYNNVFGRKGMSLSLAKKKAIAASLKDKFTSLEENGISEVPDNLKNIESRTMVLESIRLDEDDEFAAPIIESAIMQGFIELELDGDSDESLTIKKDIAYDNIAQALMNTFMGTTHVDDPNKRSYIVTEATKDLPDDLNIEEFVAAITKNPDGTPTEFSTAFNIESVEDFHNNYIEQLKEFFDNGEQVTALGIVQTLVSTYVKAMLTTEGEHDITSYLNTPFRVIAMSLTKEDMEGENEGQEPDMEGERQEPDMEGERQEPVTESADDKADDVKDEQQTDDVDAIDKDDSKKPENNNGGHVDMLLDEIKTLLESNFEGVEIGCEDDAKKVVEQLITDYQQTFSELRSLELDVVKGNKITELKQAGVQEDVIQDELDGIESVEELDEICDKLIILQRVFKNLLKIMTLIL